MAVTGVGRPYLRGRFPTGVNDVLSRASSGNVYPFPFVGSAPDSEGTGELISGRAALYGTGVVTRLIAEAATPGLLLDMTTNLNLGSVPQIKDREHYEAVLHVHDAIEVSRSEQDTVNADIEARVAALEP